MAHDLPPIGFSPWHAWEQRDQLTCRRRPGVYLLAFDVAGGKAADLLDPRIIYIGETCDELAGRWRRFERAASDGKSPHSGGRRYHGSVSRPVQQLCVAAWAPDVGDPVLRDAYIRYTERKLILDWVVKHGKLPLCNAE